MMENLFARILAVDESVSRKMRVAEKPGLLRNVATFFAHSGDSWFWGIGLVLLWIIGDLFWQKWALIQLFLIVVLAVIVLFFKFSIRRKRPEGEWGAIYRNTDPHSFPSGHAARAFLIAAMAIALGPTWMAILLAIWAPLVTFSRVMMGVHYFSDVIAGAALGIVVTLIGLQFLPLLGLG